MTMRFGRIHIRRCRRRILSDPFGRVASNGRLQRAVRLFQYIMQAYRTWSKGWADNCHASL
jgi:hypothetical protein